MDCARVIVDWDIKKKEIFLHTPPSYITEKGLEMYIPEEKATAMGIREVVNDFSNVFLNKLLPSLKSPILNSIYEIFGEGRSKLPEKRSKEPMLALLS